ncbi:MAG TPA: hypothetical protein VK452_02455 [Dissulfurispiraceae bacterium]|nr:hypothetical protein [Dissulfurispiraceae bacterium]
MKRAFSIALLFALCFMPVEGSYSADQAVDAEKNSYLMKLEERYQKAIALREKGAYDESLALLQQLVNENQGSAKFEIARLDTILEQSRDMKESDNIAWKNKAREAGYRIKTLLAANSANSDYWVVYAKYSWLVEANKETHITKAIKKAFYYKPDNPEAYIVQADYNFDKARESSSDSKQNTMMQGVGSNTEPDRYNFAKAAKSSYEAALSGKLSDARRAYVHYKMGNVKDRILQEPESAKKDWEEAIRLSPDSKAGKLSRQRLGI